MDNIMIKHVSDFISLVESNSAKYKDNPHFLFRGESLTTYTLVPTLYRTRNCTPNKFVYLYPNTERKILLEFMTEAAGYVDSLSVDDFSRWVEFAQHFGVPTRLLDWTSNPLIALFFACIDNLNQDGRIYILHSRAYKELADKANRDEMEGKMIKDVVKGMILEQEKGFKYPIIYAPYHLDKRMVAQASRFMVWGSILKPLDELITELEKEGKSQVWIKKQCGKGAIADVLEDAMVLASVVVSGKYKKRLLHELDALGISYASIFPGLEGLGRSIKWRNDKSNSEYDRFD